MRLSIVRHRRSVALLAGIVAIVVSACGLSESSQPSGVSPSGDEDALSELGDLVWLRGRAIEENDVVRSYEMDLVRVDGSLAWSGDLDVLADAPNTGVPFLSGPRNGRLAYARLSEIGTTIVLADAVDGSTTDLATVTETVVAGILEPDARAIYLVIEGNTPAIERLQIDGDRGFADLAPLPPLLPEAVQSSANLLHVTPSGGDLVAERCDALGSCWWTVVDTASGDSRKLRPDGAGSLVDLTDDTLLARSSTCAIGTCPFVIVDLDSGEVREWDPGAHEARLLVAEDGATVLAYDTQGVDAAGPQIVLADVTTLAERPLPALDRAGRALGLARTGQDDWAPPGWLVATPPGLNVGEGGGPVLIRISDGEVVELPIADER